MAAKELPDDWATLAFLRDATDRLLAVLEPVRQQLTYSVGITADMLEGDFTEAGFFDLVSQELQRTVARGFPPHQVLTDYLDLEALAPPSQVPAAELERLNRLVATGTATAADKERHGVLARIRNAEYRDAIGAFVDRVHDLQRRIIAKLDGSTARPLLAGQGEDVEDGTTATPPRGKSSNKARKKAAAPRAEPRFDEYGVGIDANRRWQVFQRFGNDWRHQGVMNPQPTVGHQTAILTAFLDKQRTLSRAELVRAVRAKHSDYEGKKLYKVSLLPALSRLRGRLRKALGLPPRSRPITWQKSIGGFCLLIQIGYAHLGRGPATL